MEKKTEALHYLREGLSVAEISVKTGINRTTIHSIAKKYKVSQYDDTKPLSARNTSAFKFLVSDPIGSSYTNAQIIMLMKSNYSSNYKYVIDNLISLNILNNKSLKYYVTDKFGSVGCSWYENQYKKLVSNAKKYNEDVWFIMLDNTKYNAFKDKESTVGKRSYVACRTIVMIMRPKGKDRRVIITKPGISAAKIYNVIQSHIRVDTVKNIRVVILDERIDCFSSLKKNYPQIEIEIPFAEVKEHDKWLYKNLSAKKIKSVKKLLLTSDDIDHVANLSGIDSGVVRLIKENN